MRIIPTRVGTSLSVRFFKDRKRDHPHACGDKFNKEIERQIAEGSSPRVWGQAKN